MNSTKFEIGSVYSCASICDHNCIYSGRVIRRTTSTVTFDMGRYGVKTLRISRKISEYAGCECVYPMGHYSMCPLFEAARPAA